MKRYVFPYEIKRYVTGLFLAVIFAVLLAIISSLIDNSPMPWPRLRDNIILSIVIFVPLLTICSLVRHYWLPMVILIFITASFNTFVLLNWMPYPVNMSIWNKLWVVVSINFKMILVYVIEGVYFQQYCKRVCCLPENKLGG